MKTLSKFELKLVSGGATSVSDEGILATDGDSIVIKGMRFTSDGQMINTYTNKILFDFTKDGDNFCFFGHNFTATPVENGYLFQTGSCKK